MLQNYFLESECINKLWIKLIPYLTECQMVLRVQHLTGKTPEVQNIVTFNFVRFNLQVVLQ